MVSVKKQEKTGKEFGLFWGSSQHVFRVPEEIASLGGSSQHDLTPHKTPLKSRNFWGTRNFCGTPSRNTRKHPRTHQRILHYSTLPSRGSSDRHSTASCFFPRTYRYIESKALNPLTHEINSF